MIALTKLLGVLALSGSVYLLADRYLYDTPTRRRRRRKARQKAWR